MPLIKVTLREMSINKIAIYHTAKGHVAYEISSSVSRTGAVVYSYTGKYGAGSGHSIEVMKRMISTDLFTRRGMHLVSGVCITSL